MSTTKKYKTCFQDGWLSNPKYSVRLEKGASDDVAKCKICLKTFSRAAMRIKALDSHGTKHKSRTPVKSKSSVQSAFTATFMNSTTPSAKTVNNPLYVTSRV